MSNSFNYSQIGRYALMPLLELEQRANELTPDSETERKEFRERVENHRAVTTHAHSPNSVLRGYWRATAEEMVIGEMGLERDYLARRIAEERHAEALGARLAGAQIPDSDPALVMPQLAAAMEKLRPKFTTDAPQVAPRSIPPQPNVQQPTPTAKPKLTEAAKLDGDRRRHGATGEFTTRLLCDIYSVERGALGQYLRKLHKPTDAEGKRRTPIISTSVPRKFTLQDRTEVEKRLAAGAVKKRPKQPDE